MLRSIVFWLVILGVWISLLSVVAETQMHTPGGKDAMTLVMAFGALTIAVVAGLNLSDVYTYQQRRAEREREGGR